MRRLLDQNTERERRRQERILLVLERRFAGRFSREIASETRRMADFLEITGEVPPPDNRHLERMMKIETDLAEAATRAFGGRIIQQGKNAGLILEAKFDFGAFFMDTAISYVSQEMIRRRITNMTQTTRNQVVGQVTRGFNDGLGVAEIAKGVMQAAPKIAKWRGPTIARTETHGAANNGADAAARQTGMQLKKEWISVKDARTRDPHRDAEGQIVEMDGLFDVGGELLRFPGDPAGSAANVINCRCAVGHIVDDPFIRGLDADGPSGTAQAQDTPYQERLAAWKKQIADMDVDERNKLKRATHKWIGGARDDIETWRAIDKGADPASVGGANSSRWTGSVKRLLDEMPVKQDKFYRGTFTDPDQFDVDGDFTVGKLISFSDRKKTAEHFMSVNTRQRGDNDSRMPVLLEWIGKGLDIGETGVATSFDPSAAINVEYEFLLRAGQSGKVISKELEKINGEFVIKVVIEEN